MPELAEVETVVRTLEYQCSRCTIHDCMILYDKLIDNMSKDSFISIIKGKTIQGYGRYGKYLMFDLGDYMWIVHLRMEGKFYLQDPRDDYDRHVHAIFTIDHGKQIRYHDTRKFGRMYLYEKQDDIHAYDCFKNVGLDLFDERLDANYLYRCFKKKKYTLKQALLDQSIMAGIGNIYADEICFQMKLHPLTKIYHLRKKDCERLLEVSREILKAAISLGGTTIQSYTSSLGVTGRFQLHLKVHDKKGETCQDCGQKIIKIKVAGRGTSYCPTCQKRR